jgi:hypothetical protein
LFFGLTFITERKFKKRGNPIGRLISREEEEKKGRMQLNENSSF